MQIQFFLFYSNKQSTCPPHMCYTKSTYVQNFSIPVDAASIKSTIRQQTQNTVIFWKNPKLSLEL